MFSLLTGIVFGYVIGRNRDKIIAFIKEKFGDDDGGPPAFVG